MAVLLLGDVTGRSCVGVRMLTHVLEARGRDVLALPTALISNTLNLGRAQKLDTTGYLLDTLETWDALGSGYDCVYIGYVTGMAQAEALCRVADRARARGAWVLVDPILGDHGRKYHSVTDEQARAMALLTRHADVITPNLTEACLLTGTAYAQADAAELARRLADGGRSVLITSAKDAQGRDAVVGVDAETGKAVAVPFERVPVETGGTGDRFCALLMDAKLEGKKLEAAAKYASEGVKAALLKAAFSRREAEKGSGD